MAYKRRWLRPGKVLEHYIYGTLGVHSPRDASYQLYQAVVDGEVRGRREGQILDAKALNEIRSERWSNDPNDLYVLPFHIEVSLDDVERIWGDDDLDPADRIALGGMSKADVALAAETALLNLRHLLDRLDVRHQTSTESADQFGAEFESGWVKNQHEAVTYIAHVTDSARRKNLQAELNLLESRRIQLRPMSVDQLGQSLGLDRSRQRNHGSRQREEVGDGVARIIVS